MRGEHYRVGIKLICLKIMYTDVGKQTAHTMLTIIVDMDTIWWGYVTIIYRLLGNQSWLNADN